MSQIEKKIISSLHRPANTRLKTCTFVCKFIKNNDVEKSAFRNEFLLDFLIKLYKYYNNIDEEQIYGLPSKKTVYIVNNKLENLTKKDKLLLLKNFELSKRNKEEDDQRLFSFIKTIGYYISLSETLSLIDKDFNLTEDGKYLSEIISKDFIKLSQKEKYFFFEKIIMRDTLFILPLIYWKSIVKKYSSLAKGRGERAKYANEAKEFIIEMSSSKNFFYKLRSWDNYIIVRNRWLTDIGCISESGNIKPSYQKIIDTNAQVVHEIENIQNSVKDFLKNKARPKEQYVKNLDLVYNAYKFLIKKYDKKNYAFINLHDLAKELNFSYNKMQIFLNFLVEDKKNWRNVHFNNLIGAADSRKRFAVGNKKVLNIKIVERFK